MKIVTGREMAEIDRVTIEEMGMPGPVLMENAARSLCRAFMDRLGGYLPRVLVLCGSGNNGGDGFCIARILSGYGMKVKIAHVGRPQTLKPDARLYYELAQKYGLDIIPIKEEKDLEELQKALDETEWIIDALFGTGLSKPIRGNAGKALEIAALSNKPCVAVDVPSGINSDTGEVMGPVIRAALTVTFGLPKWGHLIFPGADYTGELIVADIGFPPSLAASESLKAEVTSLEHVQRFFPPRPLNSHKGSLGKLSIIGGSRYYLGAPGISAKAAMKTGAGYIRLHVPYLMEPFVKTIVPDIVTKGLPDVEGGFFSTNAFEYYVKSRDKADALAIGPGMDRRIITLEFAHDIIQENSLPMVIDADALIALSEQKQTIRNEEVEWVMTPHPGEAAALLKKSVDEILSTPLESAKEISEKYKAVVILKGPNSLIVSPDGRVRVNPTGNPILSIMGSGDILTGIIGALLAKGIGAFDAATAGAFIHGLAGDIAAETIGPEGASPLELVNFIPGAVDLVRKGQVKTGPAVII